MCFSVVKGLGLRKVMMSVWGHCPQNVGTTALRQDKTRQDTTGGDDTFVHVHYISDFWVNS